MAEIISLVVKPSMGGAKQADFPCIWEEINGKGLNIYIEGEHAVLLPFLSKLVVSCLSEELKSKIKYMAPTWQ